MNASGGLVLTSASEGSPTIVKEALACGLPVVSVDAGDVAERIGGIAGCHIALPQAGDLAAKLMLVAETGRRLEVGEKVEELSLQKIARRLERFYCETLVRASHTAGPLDTGKRESATTDGLRLDEENTRVN
jgi:glycosyltransferase involved in cell wall biosynthesis